MLGGGVCEKRTFEDGAMRWVIMGKENEKGFGRSGLKEQEKGPLLDPITERECLEIGWRKEWGKKTS